MHLFLSPPGDEDHLSAELRRQFPFATLGSPAQRLRLLDAAADRSGLSVPLVFARQMLIDASAESAASISTWSQLVADRVMTALPEDRPWRLHITPHYGLGRAAGRQRCSLIRAGLLDLLRRRRRHLRRHLVEISDPFTHRDSLVQLALASPDSGFLSVTPAPAPFELRHRISPFPDGDIPVASDKAAPCRAFAKLAEAELRLGRVIRPGEHCVDLGASPGSWSYLALARGAHVTAVDRTPLREDLHRNPRLQFQRGDAFTFHPPRTVDWLLCDVIAAPERSIGLLLDWLTRRLCRAFVVTIKFKGSEDYAQLDLLKAELPRLCHEFILTRLCANKNEACAAGLLRP